MKFQTTPLVIFALAAAFLSTGVHYSSAQESNPPQKGVADSKELIASMEWKEISLQDLVIHGLDVGQGVLFFKFDKYKLYFKPGSGDAATRAIALTAIMAELRQAKSIVITYSTLARTPSSLHFPAYLPVSLAQTGGSYSSVGGIYFKY